MKYTVGDICLYHPNEMQAKEAGFLNNISHDAEFYGRSVKIVGYHKNGYCGVIEGVTGRTYNFVESALVPINKGNIMKEALGEVKAFLKDNRQLVGTVVLVLVLDHLVFGGALRERLKDIVNKMLGKVEKSLEK